MRTFAGAVAAAGLALTMSSSGGGVLADAAEIAAAPESTGCDAAAANTSSGTTSGTRTAAVNAKWLIGTWQNPYYTVRFRDKAGVIHWEMLREAAHPSERWSLESAMQASGTVTGISACALEMTGRYDWDEAARHVGMALTFKGTRAGADGLAGELYGATQEWTPISFLKTE